MNTPCKTPDFSGVLFEYSDTNGLRVYVVLDPETLDDAVYPGQIIAALHDCAHTVAIHYIPAKDGGYA